MSRLIRIGAAASALALSLAAAVVAVHAQETAESPQSEAAAPAVDPATVVAHVGDQEVTEGDVQFATEAFASELANVPDDQKRSVTIDAIINMELMAQAARDRDLDKTEEFKQHLDFMRTQALRNTFVQTVIQGGLTDEELQQGYTDLVVAPFKPAEEIRARHILMETKEEAEEIIAQLQDGGSFEELAKQSKDPTGENGGDLGFFARGQMVGPFEDAAFALEPGEITEEPVETEFGWHVIKLEEKRMSEPPSFAQVEPQLRNYLLRQKFETVLADLHDQYDVEIIGAPATEESPDAAETPAGDAPAESPASGEAEADDGAKN